MSDNNSNNNNNYYSEAQRRRLAETIIFSPPPPPSSPTDPWVLARQQQQQRPPDPWGRREPDPWASPFASNINNNTNDDANNNPPGNDSMTQLTTNTNTIMEEDANRRRFLNQVNATATQEAVWRERERRQFTVRAFMMFLFLLLLLEDDPNRPSPPDPWKDEHGTLAQQQQLRLQQQRLRRRHAGIDSTPTYERHYTDPTPTASSSTPRQHRGLEAIVWESRQDQDAILSDILTKDPRYQAFLELNKGVPVDQQVQDWATKQVAATIQARLAAVAAGERVPVSIETDERVHPRDADDDKEPLVWHYPWNATGFFLGNWVRQTPESSSLSPTSSLGRQWQNPTNPESAREMATASNTGTPLPTPLQQQQQQQQYVLPHATEAVNLTEAPDLENVMLQALQQRKEQAGVHFLPRPVRVRDDHNLTRMNWEQTVVDSTGRVLLTPDQDLMNQNPFWKLQEQAAAQERRPDALTLKQNAGRVALRLYARPVPAMAEMSIIDGSVKLFDRNSHHYASPKDDVVIRVRGVLFHKIGKLSLVSVMGAPVTHSALILQRPSKTVAETASRRLMEVPLGDQVSSLAPNQLKEIRDDVWTVYGKDLQPWLNENHRRLQQEDGEEDDGHGGDGSGGGNAVLAPSLDPQNSNQSNKSGTNYQDLSPNLPLWSDVVIPFPYVRDDADETIRQIRTPASKRLLPQERLLQENANHCRFEMDFTVAPVEWTLGEWRKLMSRKIMEKERLKPRPETENPRRLKTGEIMVNTAKAETHSNHAAEWSIRQTRRRPPPPQDEALVMVINGTIASDNCHFVARVNATALRTNWELTTGRAMNYSFYMMLVCLAQIVVLLRQLLHSQSQSAATRVSMICVGWQTVLDGLLCLGHIYLSLAMNNLFTPFASVAFFKLLIFCLIEMKYMAIIISARNSANGGQPTEVLRRQVAVLHLRYYVALFGSLLLSLYIDGETKQRLYFLALYSFWVPQIILNVITQAKTPLHKHYIYGMSISRLIAPIYFFCIRNNFMREVYPDSPYDPLLGQLLILWVGIQTAVLFAQGKYGARFMVPSCLLPPKFDYSRPIPVSMLPPGALEMHTDPMEDETRVVSALDHKREPAEVVSSTSYRHTTSLTTRLRRATASSPAISNSVAGGTGPSTTTVVPPATRVSRPTLDCCICYDGIDIRDRQGYMLAPCDHLFHRQCLLQWMDVKMECPICRSDLPAV